jgi:hypothetical protein
MWSESPRDLSRRVRNASLAELDRPVLGPGLMHDLAGGQVQRREQIGDPVAPGNVADRRGASCSLD